MKTKVFDCVQMKDKIQEAIYEEIGRLSPEEQIAYYRRGIEEDPEFRKKFARIRKSRFPAEPESKGAE